MQMKRAFFMRARRASKKSHPRNKPMPRVVHLTIETPALASRHRPDASSMTRGYEMNPARKTFTLAAATAVILLPLIGTAFAGESATPAPHAAIVLAPQTAHGANDCIRLGVRSRAAYDSAGNATTVLSNYCDYAVTVSYCIAEPDADVRACGDAAQRITRTLPAYGRVQAADRVLADRDVNWIACRALPGGATQFSADGTRGRCLAGGDTMQARAQTD
jgi:hypothetical protein